MGGHYLSQKSLFCDDQNWKGSKFSVCVRGCVSRGCRGVAHPRNLRRVHFTPPKFDRQLDKRVVKFKVCSKNFLLLRVIFQRSVILHPRFQIPNALSEYYLQMAKQGNPFFQIAEFSIFYVEMKTSVKPKCFNSVCL